MRIGHFVGIISRWREGGNVSGHIQLPLYAMKMLQDAGHENHLITNKFGLDYAIPRCKSDGIPVDVVDYAQTRDGKLNPARDGKRSLSLRRLARQLYQIRCIARHQKFDVLHFYGAQDTIPLAGMARLMGIGCPVVVTMVSHLKRRPDVVWRFFARRVAAVLTATDFVKKNAAQYGLNVQIIRHGVIRDLRAELSETAGVGPRCRVLFWREASTLNGGDLCLEAFDQLAPQFPKLSFDFAIRNSWHEVPGIEALARRHCNVHVYRFPYPPGLSLAKLVAESLLVVLPFRQGTMSPQLSVAESLAAGVACVSVDMGSIRELITHGHDGALIPKADAAALTSMLQQLLSNPNRTLELGRQAAKNLAEKWNWNIYVDDVVKVYSQLVS